MLKFLKKTATTFWEKTANIALGYVINVVWAVGVIKFYNWLFEFNQYSNPFGQAFTPYKRPEVIDFVGAVIMAPLIEEILFRKFPLDLAKASKKDEILIPAMLFTSVVFGLVHSGGAWSVPLQGVGGFIIACVYIKNGYSYWSAVALHCMWNLSLTIGLLHL